jgi:hypothetical protein
MTEYLDGYYLFDHDVNYLAKGVAGDGKITGLAASGYAAVAAITVSSGAAVINGAAVTSSFASLSFTADATYPKKSVVYISSSGVIGISHGTASTTVPAGQSDKYSRQPIPPNPPANCVIIAEVWIPAAATLGSSCTFFNYDAPNYGVYTTYD